MRLKRPPQSVTDFLLFKPVHEGWQMICWDDLNTAAAAEPPGAMAPVCSFIIKMAPVEMKLGLGEMVRLTEKRYT